MRVTIEHTVLSRLDYIFGTTWRWELHDDGLQFGGYSYSFKGAKRKALALAAKRGRLHVDYSNRTEFEV